MELLYDSDEKYDYYYKGLILGKSQIGKSLFVSRINFKSFFEFKKNANLLYKPTIGFDFVEKKIKINDKIIRLGIWDSCGGELYISLIQNFFQTCFFFLVFYECQDRDSFEKAKDYINNIKKLKQNLDEFPIFLIRIKYELNIKRKQDFVSDEEVLEFADEKNAYLCHLSIFERYETGINELLFLILEKIKEDLNKRSNRVE